MLVENSWENRCDYAAAMCDVRKYAEALSLLREALDLVSPIPLRLVKQTLNLIVFLDGGEAALSEYYKIEDRLAAANRSELMGICFRGIAQGYYADREWHKALEYAEKARGLLVSNTVTHLDLILIGSYAMIGQLNNSLDVVQGLGGVKDWDRGLAALLEALTEADDFRYVASAIKHQRPDFSRMASCFVAFLEGDSCEAFEIARNLPVLSENPIIFWNTFYVVANKLRMPANLITFIVRQKCLLFESYKVSWEDVASKISNNMPLAVLMLKVGLSFFDIAWSTRFYREVVRKGCFLENIDYVMQETGKLDQEFVAKIQEESDAFRRDLCKPGGSLDDISPVEFEQRRITLLLPYRVLLGQFNVARKSICNYIKFCEVAWKEIEVTGEKALLKIIPFHSADITFFDVSDAFVLSYHSHQEQSNRVGKVLHVMEGPLDGYYTVDCLGYSGWSSVATAKNYEVDGVDGSAAELLHASLVQNYIKANRSRLVQSKAVLEPEEAERIDGAVFFALQMLNDRVAEHTEFSMLEALSLLAQWVRKGGGKAVVKRHPNCRSSAVEHALNRAHQCGVYVTRGSIHHIIPLAKMVVTVNSSVGFEALLHLKPVLTLGKSDYCWATTSIKEGEDLLCCLSSPPAVDPMKIKKFLYRYLKEDCVYADNDAIAAVIRQRLIGPYKDVCRGELNERCLHG